MQKPLLSYSPPEFKSLVLVAGAEHSVFPDLSALSSKKMVNRVAEQCQGTMKNSWREDKEASSVQSAQN
jgi:hypothetical protein